MRNPFRRRDRERFGPVDGSSFYGRHAANPATEGNAPLRRFRVGEHRPTSQAPKVREARPIRKVPGTAARQFSDGAAQSRGQRDRDFRVSLRNRQRGDNPREDF